MKIRIVRLAILYIIFICLLIQCFVFKSMKARNPTTKGPQNRVEASAHSEGFIGAKPKASINSLNSKENKEFEERLYNIENLNTLAITIF